MTKKGSKKIPDEVRDLLRRSREYIDQHMDHRCWPEAKCYGHKLVDELDAQLGKQ